MSLDVKRVPKWAYYASGAVVAGVVGLRLWSNRGGGESTEAVAANTDPNAGPTSTYATTSTVPVFMGGDNSSGAGGDGSSYFGALVDGAFGLATSALGAANETTHTIADAFGSQTAAYNEAQGQYADIVGGLASQAMANQADYASSIASIMSAGAAPSNVQQTPVINYTPPSNPNPASIAANPTAGNTAPSGYPKQNKATGKWYREEIATAKFTDNNGHAVNKGQGYNLYQDGTRVKD